jgi:hypothetical protein
LKRSSSASWPWPDRIKSGTFNVIVRDAIAPEIASVTPSASTLAPTELMTAVTFAVVARDVVDSAPICLVTHVVTRWRWASARSHNACSQSRCSAA